MTWSRTSNPSTAQLSRLAPLASAIAAAAAHGSRPRPRGLGAGERGEVGRGLGDPVGVDHRADHAERGADEDQETDHGDGEQRRGAALVRAPSPVTA